MFEAVNFLAFVYIFKPIEAFEAATKWFRTVILASSRLLNENLEKNSKEFKVITRIFFCFTILLLKQKSCMFYKHSEL